MIAYCAVLRWCVGFLDMPLAVSEFSVLLCVVDGLRLLIWGMLRMDRWGVAVLRCLLFDFMRF